jgi:hypothetical protein
MTHAQFLFSTLRSPTPGEGEGEGEKQQNKPTFAT